MRLIGFAVILTLALTPVTPAAQAPQPTRVFRIVELNPTPVPQEQQRVFRQALRELGYVQGENILIEDRFAAGSEERLREYAAEAARLKADVIVAISSFAVRATATATKTIPVVALDVESDPVASGFVASLGRPSGNITGVFLDLPELNGKLLEFLREAIPGITRIAVLRDATLNQAPIRAAEVAARALSLQLQVVQARGPGDFDGAFGEIVKGRSTAMMVIPSPMFGANRKAIADLAVKHRLATTSILPQYAEDGLLMSYGPNLYGLYRQAAIYVDRILKGTRPGDLPVQRPTKFELVINRKTARALGLTIPPSLLQRADQVIQ
jgi:putative ABC transport system substrate-binding protein